MTTPPPPDPPSKDDPVPVTLEDAVKLESATITTILNARKQIDMELERLKANSRMADRLSLTIGVLIPIIALILALAGLIFGSKFLVDVWIEAKITEAQEANRIARESWQDATDERIASMERSGRMLAGEITIDRSSADWTPTNTNNWHKTTRRVEFPHGYFRRPPVVFISVSSVTFNHHDAEPFTYWVQCGTPDADGVWLTALIGNKPPEKFSAFRILWIAIEPRESD